MNLRKDHSHKCSFTPATHHIDTPLSSKRTTVQPVDVAFSLQRLRCYLSLATTNALARGSLKDAANCVTHLELQISEKDKDSERILRVELAQLTWLAVIAICSRYNSEVVMVISCCRLVRRRRDRKSFRAFRLRAQVVTSVQILFERLVHCF